MYSHTYLSYRAYVTLTTAGILHDCAVESRLHLPYKGWLSNEAESEIITDIHARLDGQYMKRENLYLDCGKQVEGLS